MFHQGAAATLVASIVFLAGFQVGGEGGAHWTLKNGTLSQAIPKYAASVAPEDVSVGDYAKEQNAFFAISNLIPNLLANSGQAPVLLATVSASYFDDAACKVEGVKIPDGERIRVFDEAPLGFVAKSPRGSLPRIGSPVFYQGRFAHFEVDDDWSFSLNVRAELALIGLSGVEDGRIRSLGSLLGLSQQSLGVGGGAARIPQGPSEKSDPYERENKRNESRLKQALGPVRHVLLSGQIAVSALLISVGLFVGFYGFYRAGYFIDRAADGLKIEWLRISFWLCSALCGALLSSAVVIFWS